jgi:hypothetical protein
MFTIMTSEFFFQFYLLYSFEYEYIGIFAQSKNYGARETADANEQLWNNIRF